MKQMRRIVSVVLSLAMLYMSGLAAPVQAIADTARERSAIMAYNEATDFSPNQKLQYSPLIGEDETARAESMRVFLRADGARESVMYALPVNYWKDSKWQAIDNTLELVTLRDGTKAYVNKANDFVVQFAQNFDSNELVAIESNGDRITWRFVGAEEAEKHLPIPEETTQQKVSVPETTTSSSRRTWNQVTEDESDQEMAFERIWLHLDPELEENDCDIVPDFYTPVDWNDEEKTASLFVFSNEESDFYRVYGQYDELIGFFACNENAEQVETDRLCDEEEDLLLFEGLPEDDFEEQEEVTVDNPEPASEEATESILEPDDSAALEETELTESDDYFPEENGPEEESEDLAKATEEDSFSVEVENPDELPEDDWNETPVESSPEEDDEPAEEQPEEVPQVEVENPDELPEDDWNETPVESSPEESGELTEEPHEEILPIETANEETAEDEITSEDIPEEVTEAAAVPEFYYETLEITAAEAQVYTDREAKAVTDEERDMQLRFPPELTSRIEYADPETGLNLQYVLTGKALTEYIHLAETPKKAVQYTVEITSKGMELSKEGGMACLLNQDGETVFKFGQPVMFDAAGEESSDIRVVFSGLDEETGTFMYTLIPDLEWLQSEERQYPISIDPDIQLNFVNNFQDTFVNSGSKNTNYSTEHYMRVSKSHVSLINIPSSTLPTLSSGDVIVEATLNLNRRNANSSYANKDVRVSPITGSWTPSTVTWNTMPSYDTSMVWSLGISSLQYYFTAFDITKIVQNWYGSNTTNHGLALYNSGSYSDFFTSEYTDNSSRLPYLSIIYRNSTGLEDTWTYYSQEIGRAGTSSINTFSGNLTLTHPDATIVNGALPISLSHVYNTNDIGTDIGYGNGWRLNYAQSIEKVSITSRDGTTTYYRLIDGDGTRHYYKANGSSTTEYVNELDKDSKLTISGTTVTITDKGGNKLIFACNSGAVKGRLTTVEDANGNQTIISYASTDVTNLRISAIQEKLSGQSAGQSLTMTYSSNLLTKVTSPDGLNVSYAYSSGKLTTITYADSRTSTYTYDSHNCLTKATNIDSYGMNFTYGTDAPYRVTRVAETTGTTTGQYLDFIYGRNKTTVKDAQNRKTVYHTDNIGQPVSVTDPDGRAVYAAYNTADRTVTQMTAVSKTQTAVGNPLKNHGFEESTWPSSWTRSDTTNIKNDSSKRHTGAYSCKMVAGSSARTLSQSVSVTSGQVYTLSAYFSGTLNTAYLRVTNGSTTIQSPAITAGGDGWNRESLTFTAAASSITIAIVVPSGSGTVYVDSVQLEKGSAPSRYNLIMNSDFASGTSNYTLNYGSDCAVVNVANAKYAGARDTHPAMLDSNVYEMNGKLQAAKITQSYLSGNAGDTYTFGAWAASNNVPLSEQRAFYGSSGSNHMVEYGIKRLTLQFMNSNDVVLCSGSVDFAADTDEWQFASGTVTATSSYAKMALVVEYTRSLNVLYLDGVQLYKEQFATGYSYDSSGNLSGMVSLIGQSNSFNYNSNNDMTSSTDALGHTTNYTYDSKHNLLTATSPLGVVTTNTYNAKGQVTETKVGNSSTYIRSSSAYNAANGLRTSVTDARGNSVSYGYNATTRQNTTITDPKGNVSTYTYGNAANMLRLASLASSGTGTVSYGYDNYGKLTTITRGSTTYGLTYDSWRRPVATKVGSTALSTNAYDGYSRLSTVMYANGFAVQYVYDNLDHVVQIKIRPSSSGSYTLAYENIYNDEGTLYEQRNYRTMRATFFTYDHAERCVAAKEKTFSGSGSSLTYGSIVSSYQYEYDGNNNLSKLSATTGSNSWNTIFTYDNDSRPLTATFASGKVLTNTYDAIGRITRRRLGLASNYDTVLTYKSGANSSQTALLATYQNGSDTAFSYDYDASGNITSITQGSTSVTYTYDAANQLTRENNGFTNQTVTYTYDNWGNITEKKVYAYTTGTLGTPTSTISYTYGNSTWGDQLTSYNGQTIAYDAMGNPTSYLGNSLTWEGKQLKTVGSTSYAYDENGLRMQKTVSGTTTNYYYNGSVLISLVQGSNTLLFSYDATGKVSAVNFNGTYYYYIRNGQGDVIKLIDNSGTAQVTYSYDTWGKQISCGGTLASTLGKLNPFRYRGYVYDEETGWYYLQSRYYNPTVGRFLSADVMLSTGQGVLGHNTFAYCLNNPASMVDTDGFITVTVCSVVQIESYSYQDDNGDLVYVVTMVYIESVIDSNNPHSISNTNTITLKYSLSDNGIVHIDNDQPYIGNILKPSIGLAFAREIKKKIGEPPSDLLSGRSVNGLYFEMVVHYLGHLVAPNAESPKSTEMGGIIPKIRGYDENAAAFEHPILNLDKWKKMLNGLMGN